MELSGRQNVLAALPSEEKGGFNTHPVGGCVDPGRGADAMMDGWIAVHVGGTCLHLQVQGDKGVLLEHMSEVTEDNDDANSRLNSSKDTKYNSYKTTSFGLTAPHFTC